MRRVAVFTMSMMLVVAACGDDEAAGPSLDLAGAAAGAQAAIDLGDELGDCPWNQEAMVAAVGKSIELGPEFAALYTSDGQVFRGGEVDITYCEVYPAESAAAGTTSFRIDVHPGTADLQQYLDEELGGEADEATTAKLLGGTVSSLCVDATRCVAAWQGNGLFVSFVVDDATDAASDTAQAGLQAAIPVVVAALAA